MIESLVRYSNKRYNSNNLTRTTENKQILMGNWQSKLTEISSSTQQQWNKQQLCSIPGLFALNHLTTIDITGEDAAKFLQGQLTCDLNEVTDEQYRPAACCTPKGRMVAIFHLFKIDDGFRFIIDEEVIEAFVKHLSKYIPFFKAEINRPNEEHLCIGLSGNLKEISNLSETKPGTSQHFGSAQLLGYSDNRWMLVTPSSDLDKYWSQFNERELISTSNDWQYLDMLEKIPALKTSSTEKFLPHEVGLIEAGGVSFTKGCYTGQEIIARMQYLGKLNKHVQLFNCSRAPGLEPGDNLVVEDNARPQSVGNLINIATNTADETLALVCLKDKFLKMAEFQVNGENRSILRLLE